MAGRFIAQIVVAGAQVFIRAFAQAYREAAANAARNGGTAAAAGNAAKQATRTVRGQMTADEARQVLNVEKDAAWGELLKRYDQQFQANAKDNGGSFYLQSKIYRAKEALEEDYPEDVRIAAEKQWAEAVQAAKAAEAAKPPPPSKEDS